MTDLAPAPDAPATRLVAVQDLRPGDRLLLPTGARVVVEAVGTAADGLVVVRWWRHAGRGEPGFRHHAETGDHCDGRYLGSLTARPPGSTVEVDA